MSRSPDVVFHVGLHKTGSTSIQTFMHKTRADLRLHDVDYYTGAYSPANHVELHLAAMRLDRMSPYKLRNALTVDSSLRDQITRRVRQRVERSACRLVVFSNEGLSLLRHPDELDRLKAMVPATGRVRILMYVREVATYLRSYASELQRMGALPRIVDQESFAYTEPDSWLASFQSRIAAFQSAFGERNVTVIDYDSEMKARGNVIPSWLETLEIDPHFGEPLWSKLFRNRTHRPVDG